MKANRTSRNDKSDRAEIGIGTMIVFIAAVIVAAIAAAVLVNTAGNLERKASDTGRETTDQVSSNIFVDDILGQVGEDPYQADTLHSVNMTVSLAPGANPIDLQAMTIRYHTNATVKDLSFASSANPADVDGTNGNTWSDHLSCIDQGPDYGFCVINITAVETNNDIPVLEPGDRVHIYINFGDGTTVGDLVYPNTEVNTRLMPQTGAPVTQGFTAPSSFGGDSWVILR